MRALAVGGLQAGNMLVGPDFCEHDGDAFRIQSWPRIRIVPLGEPVEVSIKSRLEVYILRKFGFRRGGDSRDYVFWVHESLAESPNNWLPELFGNYRPVVTEATE